MTKSLLVNANAIRIPIGDKKVHCCVCSPPYWGLRSYSGTSHWIGGDPGCDHLAAKMKSRYDYSLASSPIQTPRLGTDAPRWHDICPACGAQHIDNQLGLEPTPEQFIANMVAVFREVWRVLRDDGQLWLNLGDSYAREGGKTEGVPRHWDGREKDPGGMHSKKPLAHEYGLKPKDLVGIPWRVALALQSDGWYLRSDIIWAKPNPMPESVTDRPTKSHEYIFLLTKSERYFYDSDAIREEFKPYEVGRTIADSDDHKGAPAIPGRDDFDRMYSLHGRAAKQGYLNNSGRNRRTIWNIKEDEYEQFLAWKAEHARDKKDVWAIATAPYSGAHFATFPPALVEPCIKAGTSEYGVCPTCGSPWERVTEKERFNASYWAQQGKTVEDVADIGKYGGKNQDGSEYYDRKRKEYDIRLGPSVRTTTTGWQPTCTCFGHFEEREIDDPGDWIQQETGKRRTVRVYVPHEDVSPVPAIVFDPFNGSGTTGLVAQQLGRRYIGTDLSMEYLHLAQDRIGHTALAEWTNGRKAVETADLGPLFA